MKVCGVKRSLWMLLAILTLGPPALLGQHRRGQAAEAAQPPLSKDAPHPADYDGFTRTVALQATSDQVAQFQRLRASTHSARKSAQELLRYESGPSQSDLFHHANPLTSAIDEVLDDNEKLLLSFSAEQQAGLKKLTKKLRKSDSVLANHNKILSQTLDRDQIDTEQIAGLLQRLDRSLGDFQMQQAALAAEMGIPAHAIVEQPKQQPDVVLKR